MKKICFLICLTLFSVLAFSQWTWQNPKPQGNILYSVCFTDANTGYAVGDCGTIIKTNNGSANWTTLSSGTNNCLFSVYFTDANTGYAVGDYGTIIKTINGGITWTVLSSGTTASFYSACFTDANTGYIVGVEGTIFKTSNGGITWTALSSGTSNCLYSVYFTDANTGYAVGDYGTILKTINGGESWTILSSGTSAYLTSVYFTDANTGYAVGGYGIILKTVDAGTTWTTLSSGINNDLRSVYFTDANTGYAVGVYGNYGTIIKTINGGITWTVLSGGTTASFYSACFTDANTGYIVGVSGTIFKTSNGGITWTVLSNGTTNWLTSVYFTDANTGYAVGDYGTILKTINGGITWTVLSSGTNNWLTSVYFTDANTGYAVGDYGTILKTINGGESWTILSSGTSAYLTSVYFTDANTGYAVGNGGTFLKTVDAGIIWTALSSGTSAYLVSVYFTDANTGYAVGGIGTILKTVNAGTTWTAETSGTYNNLRSVYFTNANNGYVVGWGGTILKTTTTGINLTGNLSFGNVIINQTAQLNFLIENTSTTDITVSSITYPNGFSGNWNGGTIGAGSSKTVTVTFAPTAVQTYSGVVTIYSNASSVTNTLPISGNGVQGINGLTVSGNLDFGNVIINQTAKLNFTIDNTSSTDITVSSITYPNGFSGNWNGGIIGAGNSKTVKVTFAPTAVQTYSGEVTIYSNASSGTNTLPISGNGVQGINGLTVSGNLDFGTVPQGCVDDKPIFFYNHTSSLITIDNIVPSPMGEFDAMMQNGSTILPNHSLPVSIFFFPPGLLTYNTTFTVTSDAPNGNVTFTATGKGGINPVSWIGFYTKLENNPEINQQKMLDEHFITHGATDPIKICADGSKATIVEFINNDPAITTSNIVFNMKSDPLGNNTDFTGWFITKDYTYNGKHITAKYKHPKYLNVSGLYRKDTLQVINTENMNVIYKQAVQIYRAPVVLVHGLWGNFTSMLPIYGELLNSGKYNNSILRVTDYTNTNSYSFLANSNVIKDEINNTFLGLQLLNYSAGKVDIVAHSMGGILARIYLQNNDCGEGHITNCYRGDIHKLITLNTPHSGTQIANFILSNAWGASVARDILDYNGMYWECGAVNDLQCNSTAIQSLNGASLNNHIIPCHAIQTESSVGAFNPRDADENALTIIIARARLQSGEQFNNQVFAYTPNDLIVPTNSQKGGLNDFSFIEGVKHSKSPENSSVISTLKMLLDENPSNSVYFDQNGNGFNPPSIPPTFSKEELVLDSYPGMKKGLVTITKPTIGFTCSEGETVQIDVSGSSSINHLLVTVKNINTGITLFDTLTNSATFYYSVPNKIAGQIKIMAIGYDAAGFADLDTLNIFANPGAALDSLTFFTDNVNIPIGQSVPMTLFGYFKDSTRRDISQLNNISYDITNPDIASWNSGNILKGLAIGTTILHASYKNKDVYTFVSVYQGDNWANSIDDPGNSAEYYKLDVHPNPATNNIFFLNTLNSKSNYRIYSIIGTLIQSGQANKGLNKISVEKLVSGIYFIQLNDGKKIYFAKFVKE